MVQQTTTLAAAGPEGSGAPVRESQMTESYVPWLRFVQRAALYTVTMVLAAGFFAPLAWLVTSALKTDLEIFAIPPVWFPNPPQWGNFPAALNYIPFMRYLWNTLYIAVFTVVGALLSNTLVAYGFSRVEWPGRNAIFFIVLATTMLPYQVTMIPLYIIFSRLGWVGSYKPLIVPAFLAAPFNIFLLRQFFMTIPRELDEAAIVDGASHLRIFSQIILPLARPALAVVALFRFMGAWRDFQGPLIYINNQDRFTLSLGLTAYQAEHNETWAYLMAAATVMILPIVILFFFTQRTFIEGISLTGIKG